MPLSPQDALIYLMVVTASSDALMTDRELARIDSLIAQLPVFEGFDRTRLPQVANQCIDLTNGVHDVEDVVAMAIDALPKRHQDTRYAEADTIASVNLPQEEQRQR